MEMVVTGMESVCGAVGEAVDRIGAEMQMRRGLCG